MFTSVLLFAGLLPLVASAAVALVMLRRQSPPPLTWAVATACGFVVGRLGLKSQAGLANALRSLFNPHEAADWLPLMVLLALSASVVMFYAPPERRRRTIALAAALCVAVPVRLLSGNEYVAYQWSVGEKLAYLALLAATLGLVWLLLASAGDEKAPDVRVPLLILVAIGTAIVLTLSGVFVYGASSGAVAAALAGSELAFVIAAGRVRFSDCADALRGVAGVITFSLGNLIILAHFYAELTALDGALLLISIVATATPLPESIRRGPAWHQMAARAVVCLLPLSTALVRAVS